ncbi:uncharacterized protein [Notamacropus eugenii]|uniref:uncharacterized protein isoform X2 n=1 Tax=Notamacropus eugenii TaxID=9315 RepID=UPI003B680D74
MSFQGWTTYPSLPSHVVKNGSFCQGLTKGSLFLGRLQGYPRARSLEMPGGHSKVCPSSRDSLQGPLRATSGFLESGNLSCLWPSHNPRHLDRSQSPSLLRGIHPTEASPSSCGPFDKGSNPLIRRRASLPHLLDLTGSGVDSRALAFQGWSRSEQDLRSSLLESVPQGIELVGHLPTARGTLKEQAQEIQRQEKALELSQMKYELLDLRQKMERSLFRLEWERRELKRSRRQEQQQDRELYSKILHLQAEVMKVKLCLDRMSQQPLFVEDPEEKPQQELSSDANETLEGQGEVPLEGPKAFIPQESQDMTFLQEELVIIKEMNEQLSSELGQSHQQLRTCLDQLYQLQAEKKISHSWLQTLETERAQLVGENLVLLSVLQEQRGSTELGPAAWQNSEASGHPWFQKGLAIPHEEQEEERSCPRTHQEVVQYWKARWRQVANELKFKEEELEMVQRQRRDWSCKIPWVQELLSGEEEDLTEKDPMGRTNETGELEGTQQDSSSLTEKIEYQKDLQSRMKMLEQENAQMALEIRRWKQFQSKAEPQRTLQELQGSSSGSPQVPELLQSFQRDTQGGQEAGAPASLSEAEILRQQLQKERMLGQEQEQHLQNLISELQELKLRKPEEHKALLLTTQDSGRQGLETAENQLRESRQENLRLELLVSSLRQKLEEKEKALRELQTPRVSEQGQTEMTPSSLLKKLSLNSPSGFSQLVPEELKRGPQTGWEGVPQSHCTHCNAFLEQLDKVLQGWEASSKPAEEKPQALRQLQKVLEGPNKHAPKGGRAARSDLRDVERVKQQHRLVTEQVRVAGSVWGEAEKDQQGRAAPQGVARGKFWGSGDQEVTSRAAKLRFHWQTQEFYSLPQLQEVLQKGFSHILSWPQDRPDLEGSYWNSLEWNWQVLAMDLLRNLVSLQFARAPDLPQKWSKGPLSPAPGLSPLLIPMKIIIPACILS